MIEAHFKLIYLNLPYFPYINETNHLVDIGDYNILKGTINFISKGVGEIEEERDRGKE